MSLVDANGNSAALLTATGTLTAQAKVTNSAGQAVAGALVTFSVSDSSLAKVSPSTNLTDSNGIAISTVSVPSPSAVGAVTIIASATFTDSTNNSTTASGGANLKVGNVQNPPQSILLVSTVPADKSILIQGNTGVDRVQTAQITFKITDLNGLAVANQRVKFEFQSGQVDLTFASNTAVSGQDGTVTAVVNSGNTVTIATVKVTVIDANGNPVLNSAGQPITAISDQITVTNTVLNPSGITVGADNYAFEGFDVSGLSTDITARLTDLAGGQITDGTAVTFTTDGGAITGDNNSAKCSTINGACTVKLVGQNPRTSNGIAHVMASVQLNGSIVTKEVDVSMSGSFAKFFGSFSLDFTKPTPSCATQVITVGLSDENGNIMPIGSTLSVKGALNVSVVVVDATVKYPFYITGTTKHAIQVTPGGTPSCDATGSNVASGSFTLVVTTPSGIETPQPYTILYPTK
jgi:hypothetical protein